MTRIKSIIIALLMMITCRELGAQSLQGDAFRDSLLQSLSKEKNDTIKAKALYRLSRIYAVSDSSNAFKYADECFSLSKKNNWQKGIGLAYFAKAVMFQNLSNYSASIKYSTTAYEIFKSIDSKKEMGGALSSIGNCYEGVGYYAKAINSQLEALKIFESIQDSSNISVCYNNIGVNYYYLREFDKAIDYYQKAFIIYTNKSDVFGIGSALDNIAIVYLDKGIYDSANIYDLKAIPYFIRSGNFPGLGRIYANRGNILMKLNNADSAYYYYQQAIAINKKLNITDALAGNYANFGELYLDIACDSSKKFFIASFMKKNKSVLLDSAKYFITKAVNADKQEGDLESLMNHYQLLSETEEKLGNYADALAHHKLYSLYKDSIFNDENKKKIEAMEMDRLAQVKNKEIQLLNQQKALAASEVKRQTLTRNIIIGSVIIISLFAFVFIRAHNRKRQNKLLEEKVNQRTQQLNKSLENLKATQSQLIQSEKMASLGELTAGIAHEIQNPLNFVNNFSEVNNEMIDEASEEINNGNIHEVKNILKDIKDNSEKINYHGKRADAIVKGMLQHSRQTKSVKEPTDINALCDEYLRLSYHGMRAKDKNFNADFKTDFDNSIGNINVVPQEIGRVLLNIINNAFYTTNEKKKTADENYKLLVSVQTKKINNKVEIIVSDNGNGIPQNIIDKIFQPFFTTKPTGQGTGLGLSLAYDIITKEHYGTIRVESKVDEGTSFIINLPVV